MSKQKNTPTAEEVEDLDAFDLDNLSEKYDRKVIHRAMEMAEGHYPKAATILKAAGYTRGPKWLTAVVAKDHVLSAVWVDGRTDLATHIAPSEITVDQAKAADKMLIDAEQRMMDQASIGDVFGDDSKEVLAFAGFASRQFATSVDIIHGVAVKSAWDLKKRADDIDKNILQCKEKVTRTVIAKDGSAHEVEEDLYPPEVMVAWQKEWTTIMDTLRRFADTTSSSALARVKAMEIASRARDNDSRNKKSSRGNRDLK